MGDGAARRLLLLGVLVLTSCRLGPNYETPDTREIEKLRQPSESAESIANMAWWELYRDPALTQLVRAALENNRSAKIALLRIQESRLQLGIVSADLYPNLSIGGSGNLGGGVTTSGDRVPARSASLVLDMSYEVDLWGRIRRSKEAASEELLATEEAYRNVTISLIADVANLYFTLLDLDRRRAVVRRTLEERQRGLDTVRSRYQGGFTTELDFRQAEIQFHAVKAAEASFTRFATQTENALSVLIGRPPGPIRRGRSLFEQTMPPELPVGLASDVMRRRPDVRQIERRLHAQTARIGVAEAARFPRFTLVGSAGVNGDFGDPSLGTFFGNLGAQILSPLFNAGRNKRRVQVEIVRTEEVLQQYEQTILLALSEVEDALTSITTLRDELAARQAQSDAAEKAFDVVWSQYTGGMTTYLQVINIENSLFQSELSLSETRQRYLASVVTLYKALGGGWPTEAEKTPEGKSVPASSGASR